MKTQRSRLLSFRTLVSVVALMVIAAALLIPIAEPLRSLLRVNNGHGTLRDYERLQRVHGFATTYVRTNEQVPPTWLALIAEGSAVPWDFVSLNSPYGLDPEEDVRLGRFRAREIYKSDFVLDDLFELAERTLGTSEWERVGDFMLSRESRVYTDFPRDVVAGFRLIQTCNERCIAIFITGNSYSREVVISENGQTTDEYREMIAKDQQMRASFGLSVPLDYADLIRKYTTQRMHLAKQERAE